MGQRRDTLATLVTGLAVGVVALTVYGTTLAPTVTSEDSGELIAAAWHFGIPHPPGYPLWTMLCGIFVRIAAVGSIAWRANLFSALCGAAAASIAFFALHQVGIGRLAAAGAALVWALGRWSWSQCVITEVYALNSLVTAAGLWAVLRWWRADGGPSTRGRSGRWLIVASLLLGLGLCNHHIVALAGLALILWALILKPRLLLRPGLILSCVGAVLVGLTPYLYLPVRAAADPAINWGDPSTFERFGEHITRHQYGAVGPLPTVEPRSLSRFAGQVGYAAASCADDLTIYLTLAALLGLVYLGFQRQELFLLTLLWLACTGLLFVWLANSDLDRTSQWAMRVFLIPVGLGLVIPLGFVFDGAIRFARERIRSWPGHIVAGAIAAVGPAALVAWHGSNCDYSRYWYAYDHAENLLASMMPRGMLFPSGDHNTFPVVYLTLVEGRRPDVLIADMYGYLRPELYRARPTDSADSPEAWLLKSARRPAYYTTKKRPPVAGASFVQAGLLYHLLPEGQPFSDEGILERCSYRNLDEPSVLDHGASHILADYEFFSGLHDLTGGDANAAEAHFAAAVSYGWGIKELYNNIGSALSEHGRLDAAIEYYREAARLDRHYLLPRWNLVRVHRSRGDWAAARRELEQIVELAPGEARGYAELGLLLRERFSEPALAQQLLREALKRDPDQPSVRAALSPIGRPDPSLHP